ncbi:MAG: DUF488 family protein [Hyphomonadaceae bacterium]
MQTLCTIGYERGGLSDVIAALRDAGVEIVIDVRDIPNSRRAGFSKKMLSSSLEAAGISYRHLKPLGTPKAGREAAKRGDYAAFEEILNASLDRPEAQLALLEAAEIAAAQRACLLCLEHDWRRCHRGEIARRLKAQGFRAEHLEPCVPSA